MATSPAANLQPVGGWDAEARSALNGEIAEISPLSGGCVGEVYHLKMADGREAVAKVSRDAEDKLPIEAYMLSYLADNSDLPVPTVFHSSATLLLMSFVPGTSRFTYAAQESAAELLVKLHVCTAGAFGLERDTLIGGLHQPNPWTASWSEFFAQHRLRAMAREATRVGRFPPSLLQRVEALADCIDEWIEEPERPSLIHGDVWTTNVLADANQVMAFIDPAIYYAHAEIELAFVTLFNTFGEPFFERYQSLRPIRPGFFEVRRDVYNLYPLLVHVRLFGGSYVTSVEQILQRLGH